MRILIILSGMVGLTLLSCSNSAALIKSEYKLKPIDLSEIEGRYENYYEDSLNNIILWRVFKPFLPHENKLDYRVNKEDVVDISIQDKKLKLNLFRNDTLIDSKQVRYKIKNNVIVVSGFENSSLQGVPLILYRNMSLNLNIGLDQNDNLVITYQGHASGGLCFVIFGDSKWGEGIFKRLKK